MKDKMILCGVVCLVLALCLAACPEEPSSGPNTAPKSITITDIPTGTTLFRCTVREKITSLFDTARAEDTTPVYPDPKTFELYLAGDQNTRWRGSGDYYVVLYDTAVPQKEYWYTNSNEWTSGSDGRKKFAINSAVKTVSFNKFILQP